MMRVIAVRIESHFGGMGRNSEACEWGSGRGAGERRTGGRHVGDRAAHAADGCALSSDDENVLRTKKVAG
jgi:hypothetical protein